MDRAAYARDLCRPAAVPAENTPLLDTITNAVRRFKPDVIVSFSQNRYLVHASGGLPVLFTEMQPLPRMSGGEGFFLDNRGHQGESLLVSHANAICASHLPPDVEADMKRVLDKMFKPNDDDLQEVEAFADWCRRHANGAPVAMLAMQPPDWITYEGLIDEALAPDGLLMRWLDALPQGWRAVATYHPGFMLPEELETRIAEGMPALIPLPGNWRQGRSELLLPHVDAVVTISSAVGFSALLAGKKVVASKASNLAGFAGSRLADLHSQRPMTLQERTRLLNFLKTKYCHPLHSFLDDPGYFTKTVSAIKNEGQNFYFDPPCKPAGSEEDKNSSSGGARWFQRLLSQR